MTNELVAGAAFGGRLAGIGAGALLLSACSMGWLCGGGSGDNPQIVNSSASAADVAQAQANALPAIATECPPIKVRPGAEALFSYGGARSGSRQSLHHQLDLQKQA